MKKYIKIIYDIFISILALISVALVIMDYLGKISIDGSPYYFLDLLILLLFSVDYIYRLKNADSKKHFFVNNFVDLLAIIPFNQVFSFFRLFRLFRLTRFLKITRLLKIIGTFNLFRNRAKNFLNTNGLIYAIYITTLIIIVSSSAISYIEKKSFTDALWWSIVTSTTVGYGDIYPVTGVGKIIASALMISGIGFLGFLTSAITSFFTKKTSSNTTSIDKDFLTLLSKLDKKQQEQLNLIAESISKNKKMEIKIIVNDREAEL